MEIAWVTVAVVSEIAAVVCSVTGVAVVISTDVVVSAAAKVVVGAIVDVVTLAVDAKICCAEVEVIDLVLGVIVVAVREKSIDDANSIQKPEDQMEKRPARIRFIHGASE